MLELTQQIRNINDYDKFKERIEKKYGSRVTGHHQEQGIGVLELANGDEVRYWDDKKLIGNPFGPRGARGAHFTKTKYSEFGYKAKGEPKFETNYTLKFGAGTLAYAKRIGMTDAQIRQAERAGVGNADDIRASLDKLYGGQDLVGKAKVKERPNLNNVVGLHPSNKNWRNFLKDAELREEKKGIKHYISSNAHYIVLPDGEVITFYGYHGQVAFDKIVADKTGWLKERDKSEKELDELLHPKSTLTSLQVIHDARSPRSKSADESQSNALTIDSDDPRVERWIKDQGRSDVRGIDTPRGKPRKVKASAIRKKTYRGKTPTQVRGISRR